MYGQPRWFLNGFSGYFLICRMHSSLGGSFQNISHLPFTGSGISRMSLADICPKMGFWIQVCHVVKQLDSAESTK
jgi:hypothetical protein